MKTGPGVDFDPIALPALTPRHAGRAHRRHEGASELIHEGVIAIKAGIPVGVLADSVHAFPTAARVFGNLMLEGEKRLG